MLASLLVVAAVLVGLESGVADSTGSSTNPLSSPVVLEEVVEYEREAASIDSGRPFEAVAHDDACVFDAAVVAIRAAPVDHLWVPLWRIVLVRMAKDP